MILSTKSSNVMTCLCALIQIVAVACKNDSLNKSPTLPLDAAYTLTRAKDDPESILMYFIFPEKIHADDARITVNGINFIPLYNGKQYWGLDKAWVYIIRIKNADADGCVNIKNESIRFSVSRDFGIGLKDHSKRSRSAWVYIGKSSNTKKYEIEIKTEPVLRD